MQIYVCIDYLCFGAYDRYINNSLVGGVGIVRFSPLGVQGVVRVRTVGRYLNAAI